MPKKATRLGAQQLRIMRVLWKRDRATAKEITKELCEETEVAHSTVQTLLRMLEQKGAASHDVDDRTFVFYALVSEDEVQSDAARELVDKVFDGSVSGLMSHLVKTKRLSRKERERIRRLIDGEGSRDDS